MKKMTNNTVDMDVGNAHNHAAATALNQGIAFISVHRSRNRLPVVYGGVDMAGF